MNYNNLALGIVYIVLFYLLFIKEEKMSNTDVTKAISDIYKADIQSIRNLSKLANDLTNNGKLVVPGGLQIEGTLEVKDDVTMRKNLVVDKQTTLNEIYGGNSSIDGFKAIQVNGDTLMFNIGDHGYGFKSDGKKYHRHNKGYVKHNFEGGLRINGVVSSSDLTSKRNRVKTDLTSKINDINSNLTNYAKYGDKLKFKNEYASYYLHTCGNNKTPCGGGISVRTMPDANTNNSSGYWYLEKR